MRIVVDYTPAVQQGAGIGRHTRGLMQALGPLAVQRGHELTLLVFGPPPTDQHSVPSGCRLRVIPLSNRSMTIAWHRARLPLPVTWLSGPCDVYHAPDFVLPPVKKAAALLTVHDLSFLVMPDCADSGLRAYLSRVVPPSVARANLVLADSASTKQDLIRLLGTPAGKITVVYPGVEPRFHPPTDSTALSQVRERYGLGGKPFVLGVSTLEPRKNWPALIKAWARLRRETVLPHRLVIAGGQGWMVEGIFAAAEATGLQDDIVFTGFVDDADLPALYAAADVFASTTLYEGFGIPIVEAMACGTPVVCSDNSSLPEAAGDAALQVNPSDEQVLAAALCRAIEDNALRAAMRMRGLAHAQRFTWESSAQTLFAAYELAYQQTHPVD